MSPSRAVPLGTAESSVHRAVYRHAKRFLVFAPACLYEYLIPGSADRGDVMLSL